MPELSRLLFIGNSYTQRNDLPGLLTALVREGTGTELETDRVIVNGASLRRHWNAGTAAGLIRDEAWDAVVLQEQSTLPVKNTARYHENVRLFAPVVRERGMRLVLYLPWCRQSAPESQAVLDRAVSEIGAETGAAVVPVGPAWQRVREIAAGPGLYDADGSHPTPAGSYLAACVFYATLWDRSPEGLSVPKSVRITAEQAALHQRLAWETSRAFSAPSA